jgi:hypothetical protein
VFVRIEHKKLTVTCAQAHEDLVAGRLAVTEDKAIYLAALALHVELGRWVEGRTFLTEVRRHIPALLLRRSMKSAMYVRRSLCFPAPIAHDKHKYATQNINYKVQITNHKSQNTRHDKTPTNIWHVKLNTTHKTQNAQRLGIAGGGGVQDIGGAQQSRGYCCVHG